MHTRALFIARAEIVARYRLEPLPDADHDRPDEQIDLVGDRHGGDRRVGIDSCRVI